MVYKPRKGFYDLSKKPKSLTKKEHERVQAIQMVLMQVEGRKKEFMEDETNWRIAQEMSAELQQIVFTHYAIV